MKISCQTKLLLSFSSKPGNFGATLYNRLFEQKKIDAVYMPRFADKARDVAYVLRALECAGGSVSMPLKNEIIPHLDELSEDAKRARSVNTVVNRSGMLVGYNTDIFGARQALGDEGIHNAVIYGGGSVVDSLLVALEELEVGDITIFARNYRKVSEKYMGSRAKVIEAVSQAPSSFDLLINATPAPLEGDLEHLFRRSTKVFDLVVSATDTLLIKVCKESGKKSVPGIEMAKYQFQKQFEYYTGIEIDIKEVEGLLADYISGGN